MAEKKKKLAELEDNVRTLEANIDDMKRVQTSKSGELHKELKYFGEKVGQLSATFHEGDNLIQKRQEAKTHFDHLRVDRGASFTSKMSLQSEITAMHKKLESDRRTIHNETLLAESIMKSTTESLEVDQNLKKAELEALISEDKSHDEFLKTKSFPGKDKLVVAIQEKKEELTKMKGEVSRMKLEIEAKRSALKEHEGLLMDHRKEYDNVFAKMKTQLEEENETLVALERQIKEAVTTVPPDEYELILRNVKLYKYAEKMLQASIAKEQKLAEMLVEHEKRNVPF